MCGFEDVHVGLCSDVITECSSWISMFCVVAHVQENTSPIFGCQASSWIPEAAFLFLNPRPKNKIQSLDRLLEGPVKSDVRPPVSGHVLPLSLSLVFLQPHLPFPSTWVPVSTLLLERCQRTLPVWGQGQYCGLCRTSRLCHSSLALPLQGDRNLGQHIHQ